MCDLEELAYVQVILGADANDERHLVTMTVDNSKTTHPLCWLSKTSVLESQVRIKSWVMLMQPLHIVSSALCICRRLLQ